jgi:hypothetical protein
MRTTECMQAKIPPLNRRRAGFRIRAGWEGNLGGDLKNERCHFFRFRLPQRTLESMPPKIPPLNRQRSCPFALSLVARLPIPRCGGQAWGIWRLATRRAARLATAAGRPIRLMAGGGEALLSSALPLTA